MSAPNLSSLVRRDRALRFPLLSLEEVTMGRSPLATLTKKLSCEEKEAAACWWRTLTVEERRSLRNTPLPPETIGRFVEPGGDEDAPDDALEPDDYYEYVVAHEIVLWPERTFHICSAHIAARRVIAQERIPASFACPFAKEECPMRVLLDQQPGFDVELSQIVRRSA